MCQTEEICALQQLAIALGWAHHGSMNAYSEDLREKIVEAKERGMPTVEVARTFGVGLSSVKRYARVAREGGSLRPKRSPGRRPKADERARRLLQADLRERPAATLSERREYLRSVAGVRVSDSTVSRLLRRMGWTRKKGRWERANKTSS
jgi:transposase